MKRLIIILFILLAPLIVEARGLMMVSNTTPVVAPSGGDILSETFDNLTNYDNAGWTTSGDGSFEPNKAVGVWGAGFSGECLEVVGDAWGNQAYANKTFASAVSELYLRVYFRITTANATVRILNIRDASANLDLEVYASATALTLSESTNYTFADNAAITQANTSYRLEVHLIKGTGAAGTLSWRLDGVDQGTVTNVNFAGTFNSIHLGSDVNSDNTCTVVFDKLDVSSVDWIGE